MKFKFSCLALLLVLMLCFTPNARAHGPFDNSSQVIVRDNALELVVTMGMAGSRQFLLHAGLSEADAAAALASRGPSTKFGLPVELAPRFFEVGVNGKALVASSVSVITDGLEAAFTVTYPRPASGELSLRALYFNGIAEMKPGAFIATDENRNGLGAAMITRAKPTVELKLTASASAIAAPLEPPKPEPARLAPTNAVVEVGSLPPQPAPQAGPSSYLWLSALVLVAGGLWIAFRKINRPR